MDNKLTEIYELFIKTVKYDYLDDSNQKRLDILGNVLIRLLDLEFEKENQNKKTEAIEKATEEFMKVFTYILFTEKEEK